MGLIRCKKIDFRQVPSIYQGIIIKDQFFDEVPTLIQKDLEKWAEPEFNFKIKIENEWYLGTFYNNVTRGKEVSLSFSKFE